MTISFEANNYTDESSLTNILFNQNNTSGDYQNLTDLYYFLTKNRLISVLQEEVSFLWIIFGTIGNLLSLLVLLRRKMRIHSTFTYLTILSVCDTFVLYFGLLRDFLVNKYQLDINGHILCKFHVFSFYFVLHFASWLLVAVNVDRLIAASFLSLSKKWCTPGMAIRVSLYLGISLALLNSHFLYFVDSSVDKPASEQTANNYIGDLGFLSKTSGHNNFKQVASNLNINILFDKCLNNEPIKIIKLKKTSNISSILIECLIEDRNERYDLQTTTTISVKTLFDLLIMENIKSNNSLYLDDYKNKDMSFVDTFLRNYYYTAYLTSKNLTDSNVINILGLNGNDTVHNNSYDAESINPYVYKKCLIKPNNPGYNYFFQNIFTWLDTSLQVILPFIIMVICNFNIIRKVLLTKNKTNGKNLKRLRKIKGMCIMIVSVSVIFFVLEAPILIFICLIQGDYLEAEWPYMELSWTFLNLMMYTNHVINFFSYCMTGTKFRKELIRLLCINKLLKLFSQNIYLNTATNINQTQTPAKHLIVRRNMNRTKTNFFGKANTNVLINNQDLVLQDAHSNYVSKISKADFSMAPKKLQGIVKSEDKRNGGIFKPIVLTRRIMSKKLEINDQQDIMSFNNDLTNLTSMNKTLLVENSNKVLTRRSTDDEDDDESFNCSDDEVKWAKDDFTNNIIHSRRTKVKKPRGRLSIKSRIFSIKRKNEDGVLATTAPPNPNAVECGQNGDLVKMMDLDKIDIELIDAEEISNEQV